MKKFTGVFIISILLVIALYDFWVISKGGSSASISHVLFAWAKEYPIMPFLFGIPFGHFFWPLDYKEGE